jgi:hypothetical protein
MIYHHTNHITCTGMLAAPVASSWASTANAVEGKKAHLGVQVAGVVRNAV